MIRRALLSVTDKTGIVDFARSLSGLGFEIISTGGTAQALREAGLHVRDVASLTGSPEMLDGRVKTLHPAVHGGILADRRNESHCEQMAAHGLEALDVVCVNLYAFAEAVRGPHDYEHAVESIDIGGPAMIRSAAKNSASVWVVVDPSDYPAVLRDLEAPVDEFRRGLMAKAFRHTASYDAVIAEYLSGTARWPERLTLTYALGHPLRYGENPHQTGAIYLDPMRREGVAHGSVVSGRELSYNNLLDADAAWELVCDLPPMACAVIKHGNPCGAAVGASLAESYRWARAADPVSAFGGIAAFHGEVDLDAAREMTAPHNFLEVVLATKFSPEAPEVFAEKAGWGQTVRLIEVAVSPARAYSTVRTVRGGALVQMSDESPDPTWTTVTQREPDPRELAALRFAWTVVRHVKSNAIVLAGPDRLLGVGAGQMNRVRSVQLARDQAGDACRGAALASDAFFPFRDSVDVAAEAGVRAIIQPGGSKKDGESIAAANEHGIAMVFTGVRHFRH